MINAGEAFVLVRPKLDRGAFAKAGADAEAATEQGLRGESVGSKYGQGIAAGLTASLTSIALPAIGKVLRGGFDRFTALEDATSSLTIQMGSATKAGKLLDEVLNVVSGSPYSFDSFATGATNLTAFGMAADKIPGVLTAIGEVSASKGSQAQEYADRMIDAFGKMQAKGKVTMEELNRIMEAGVPALQILGNHYGVTADEMAKMISKGAVPAAEAIDVLTEGMLHGSNGINGFTVAFEGSMEALGENTSGKIANITTAMSRLGASFLDAVAPIMDVGLVGFRSLLEFAIPLAPAITGVVTALAGLKALQMAKSFMDSSEALFNFKLAAEQAGGGIKGFASAAVGALNPLGIAIAGIGAALGMLYNRYRENVARVETLSGSLADAIKGPIEEYEQAVADAYWATAEDKGATEAVNKLGWSWKELSSIALNHADDIRSLDDEYKKYMHTPEVFRRVVSEMAPEVQELANAILDLNLTQGDTLKFFQLLDEMAQGTPESMEKVKNELINIVNNMEKLDDIEKKDLLDKIAGATTPEDLAEIAQEILGVGEAGEQAAAGVEETNSAFETLNSTWEATIDLGSLLVETFQKVTGGQLSQTQAQADYFEATEKSNKALKEANGNLDISTEVGRKAVDGIKDRIDASYAMYEADIAAGVGIDEARGRHEKRIETMYNELEAMGYTREEIKALIGDYGDIPELVETVAVFDNIRALIDAGDLTAAAKLYDQMSPEAQAEFDKSLAWPEIVAIKQALDKLHGRKVRTEIEIVRTETFRRISERYEINKGQTPISSAPVNPYNRANGGILNFFGNGGFSENHIAEIAPAGAWRIWAEPETGGEAYIPLAASKRARSLEIWKETGKRLEAFGDGGFSGLNAKNETGGLVIHGDLTIEMSAEDVLTMEKFEREVIRKVRSSF